MIDEEFRTALHDRLGPALDQLSAPDLLAGVRARQVQHKRSVRAGLAAASVATVAAVVVAVAVWPSASSVGPSLLAPSAATSVPVVPLVASGPCAGLTVIAYQPPPGPDHPALAIAASGTVISLQGGQLLYLDAKGPCVDRLSYVPRTSAIQGSSGSDRAFAFPDGIGIVVTHTAAVSRRATVDLYLDCVGAACSGKSLATVIIDVEATSAQPTLVPAASPGGPVATASVTTALAAVPALIGRPLEQAKAALNEAGLTYQVTYRKRNAPKNTVTFQNPKPGAVTKAGTIVQLTVSLGPVPKS